MTYTAPTTLSEIESATPRLDSGTMKAKASIYLSVKVSGKGTTSSGREMTVSGTANTNSNSPTVDFSTSTPKLTW